MTKLHKRLTDADIEEMYRLSEFLSNKEIAQQYGVHEGTVSRRLCALREKRRMSATQSGTDAGTDIVVSQRSGPVPPQGMQPYAGAVNMGDGKLVLKQPPTENPFNVLRNFNDIAEITSASGSVMGSGLHSLYEAATNEDLPYEERMSRAMIGGMVLFGQAMGALATYQSLVTQSNRGTVMRQRPDIEQ